MHNGDFSTNQRISKCDLNMWRERKRIFLPFPWHCGSYLPWVLSTFHLCLCPMSLHLLVKIRGLNNSNVSHQPFALTSNCNQELSTVRKQAFRSTYPGSHISFDNFDISCKGKICQCSHKTTITTESIICWLRIGVSCPSQFKTNLQGASNLKFPAAS